MIRGQVRLVHGSGATGLQLVQTYSDSDEDSDGAWEGRLGDRYNPPGTVLFVTVSKGAVSDEQILRTRFFCMVFLVDTQPDTHEVDRSEIRTQILLATASSALKGRNSFTHMLTEVRAKR